MREITRICPVEDIHVVRSADGGDGRTVEAYAAVFGQQAEVKDHEGHYIEVNDASAFNRVIDHVKRSKAGLGQIKVLYNHGRTVTGTPSERFSVPIGVPVEIRADTRGVLTLTRYSGTPLADEVLENIRAGAITSQSYTGEVIRSDPPLRAGGRYRAAGGQLPVVRRLEMGLREFGPVLFPIYEGAQIMGVRMAAPPWELAAWEDDAADLAARHERLAVSVRAFRARRGI